MKKLLLFARDPGGANTIIPLVKPLENRGYKLSVIGKDVALTKFAQNSIPVTDIVKLIGSPKIDNIQEFLKREGPDLIITGTSADDMTEKYIWKAAQNLGIPSFAILDQWINYAIRFSGFGVDQLHDFEQKRNLEYLPNKILVMDKLAKEEALKEGLPADKILISGQPYFEQLINRKINQDNLSELKKNLEVKEENFIITYASEPIQKIYTESPWGYNEITIFNQLLDSVTEISKSYPKNFTVIIKLHPKEDISYYSQLLSKQPKYTKIKLVIDQNSNPWDLISISDLICGMSSMFLLESLIIGKPTLSIQIGLKKENPFVLNRIGAMKNILDKDNLLLVLKEIILKKDYKASDFKIIKDPIKRTINYIEESLCQN